MWHALIRITRGSEGVSETGGADPGCVLNIDNVLRRIALQLVNHNLIIMVVSLRVRREYMWEPHGVAWGLRAQNSRHPPPPKHRAVDLHMAIHTALFADQFQLSGG